MTEAQPRASGLYGLFCLDGSPIAADEARELGMVAPQTPSSWLTDGHDPHAPAAVHRHSDASGTILLVGDVSAAGDLASRLGLVQNTPTAQIAKAALARFGSDTPLEMLGEWSLLHRTVDGQLTLMVGPAMRDRLHYAIVGSKVAIASDLFRLAKIGWIGRDLDEAGMLFRWGRAHVRAGQNDHAMLSAVKQIGAGCSVVIERDGRVSQAHSNPLTPQPRWQGSFDDAVAESEALLRIIMRDRIARTKCPAIMLSGGLDSSLLAWLAAEECGKGQTVLSVTSAAPINSGLDDETAFAMQVANHLGMVCTPAFAAHDANFYRPPNAILSGASGPILSNRHCLTEALQSAAKAGGATQMIDGTFGEMTATARLPQSGMATRLRNAAAQFYHRLRRTDGEQRDEYPFHIRLAPHRFANLPEPIQFAIKQPRNAEALVPKRTGLLGYISGAEKALIQPTEFYPGALRIEQPFRDLRLYRLFAGFPVEMLLTGGHDRPVVRVMLHGHLPHAIRLRRRGMPAEPDRFYRMQRQADDARARIAKFRKAEIDDWIDLDWLDAALIRVAKHGAADNSDTNEVQLTAIAAEFLYWWRNQN